MAYFKDNAAYDLERYAKQSQNIDKSDLKLIKTTNSNKKRNDASNSKFTLIIVGFVISIIFSIYNRAILTEVTAEINFYTQQNEKLINENKILNTEINTKSSLRNVEEYAINELGLCKPETDQISYINLSAGDTVEVLGKKKTSGTIFSGLENTIAVMLSYLGL